MLKQQAMMIIASYEVHNQVGGSRSIPEITGSISVPRREMIAGKSLAQLVALKPIKVLSHCINEEGVNAVYSFGMCLSDEQTELT
jgi:hypothetical protein